MMNNNVFSECTLADLPVGDLAEIVAIDDTESIFEQIGAHVGMSVVVLKKAVASLIQVGSGQIEVPLEMLDQIRVKKLVM